MTDYPIPDDRAGWLGAEVMGENSNISWTEHTFNGWEGCTKVSVGDKGACEGCYAEHLVQNRFGRAAWGNHPRRRTSGANWRKPLIWNREAAKAGTRPFVFANSLSDVFDNQVDPEWRRDLFDLIRATPHLVWLLLTKRPQNIKRLFIETLMSDGLIDATAREWPCNAAIGCTVVTQPEADRDIPHLLNAKAVLRPAFAFVSMEPLMEAVDLRWALSRNPIEIAAGFLRRGHFSPGLEGVSRLDWAIAGGETHQGAHKARPTHPDWFRSLRDQCVEAGTPFHFKQWGEFAPYDRSRSDGALTATPHAGDLPVQRFGKHAAGRLLDGREWNERPEVSHA